MALFVPHAANSFEWWTSNNTGRPAAALGTSITPAQNTMGSYTQLLSGASVANDVFGIYVMINSNAVSAAARDTLVTVGVDPAGGTSYTDTINNLMGSCAGAATLGGVWYYFPLWIRAGSSIAAKASVNNATVGTLRVYTQVFGLPTNPEAIKVGTYVDSFGITTGTSSGTTVTSGTTSEGAWTALATSISRSCWWWQLGMGCNDTTMTALVYAADLASGDASNKRLVINDQLFLAGASESIVSLPMTTGCEMDVSAGVNLYGRLQCSGTADSALSLAAYGVGG